MKYKSLKWRFFQGFIYSLFVLFLFSSCDFFNASIKGFLKEYTESAAIISHSFSQSFPYDNSGTLSIPSNGEDCIITFELRNPQQYVLTPKISMPGVPATITSKNTVLFEQKDAYSVVLTLPAQFLRETDMGGDITPILSIYEPKSNRTFENYSIPLKSNTPPVGVSDAIIIIDETPGSQSLNQYFVCFNLPGTDLLLGKHNDIKYLKINNETFELEITPTGDVNIIDTQNRFYTTVPTGLANATNVNGLKFSPKTGVDGKSVWFKSGVQKSSDEFACSISLIDRAGLVSSVFVSSESAKLGDITATGTNKNGLVSIPKAATGGAPSSFTPVFVDKSGVATLTLSVPEMTAQMTKPDGSIITPKAYDKAGSYISYSVYYSTTTTPSITGEPFLSGVSTSSTINIAVPAGKVRIVATARKSLYAESDAVIFDLDVVPVYLYVSETGSDDKSFGSQAKSFESVQRAVQLVTNSNTALDATSTPDKYTIYVTGNITSDATKGVNGFIDIQSTKLITLEIIGLSSPHTIIDATNFSTSNTLPVINIRETNSGSSFIFKNLKITGGTRGGVKVDVGDNSNVVFENCLITGNSTSAVQSAGGIFVSRGNVTLKQGSSISGNNFLGAAGSNLVKGAAGLFVEKTATATQLPIVTIEESSSITNNTSSTAGGGIYLSSDTIVNLHGTVSNNSGKDGVAINIDAKTGVTPADVIPGLIMHGNAIVSGENNYINLQTGATLNVGSRLTNMANTVGTVISPSYTEADIGKLVLVMPTNEYKPLFSQADCNKLAVRQYPLDGSTDPKSYFIAYSASNKKGFLINDILSITIDPGVPQKLSFVLNPSGSTITRGQNISFIVNDEKGTTISPNATSISLKLGNDTIESIVSSTNGIFANLTVPSYLTTQLLNGEKLKIYMTATVDGFVYTGEIEVTLGN